VAAVIWNLTVDDRTSYLVTY